MRHGEQEKIFFPFYKEMKNLEFDLLASDQLSVIYKILDPYLSLMIKFYQIKGDFVGDYLHCPRKEKV